MSLNAGNYAPFPNDGLGNVTQGLLDTSPLDNIGIPLFFVVEGTSDVGGWSAIYGYIPEPVADPAPVPLPASALILLSALGVLVRIRRA